MLRNPGMVYRVIAFVLVTVLVPWPGMVAAEAKISREDEGIEESVEIDTYQIDYPGSLASQFKQTTEGAIEVRSQLSAQDRFRAYTVADLRNVAIGGDWPAIGAARLYDMDSSEEGNDSKDKSEKRIKVTVEWKKALIGAAILAVLLTGIVILLNNEN